MKNTSAAGPLLKLENIHKNFGGVVAADSISLELPPAYIFGLIGPNGSGKTTLLNIISGIYSPTGGQIYLQGRNITKTPIHTRAKLGISRTFQHPRLLNRCNIYANLQVGMDLAAKKGCCTYAESHSFMEQLLQAAGLGGVDLMENVDRLSYGQQKLLEIVRAILPQPVVMLVDEPAAGLNNKEMEQIVALLDLARQKGIGLLLIEHAMDLMMTICDKITVLNFGHQIATGTPAEIQSNPAVIDAYLGGGDSA